MWAIQTQLLSQIIANRISLIMASRRKALILKISLFVVIAAINIAVGVIWISAQMLHLNKPARSKRHEENIESEDRLNYIFENAEKSFFLIFDLGLNLLFLYLVRTRLIAQGLTKYWRLFNYNAWMVAICTTTDITLLGLLSHHNHYLYALPSTVHQNPPKSTTIPTPPANHRHQIRPVRPPRLHHQALHRTHHGHSHLQSRPILQKTPAAPPSPCPPATTTTTTPTTNAPAPPPPKTNLPANPDI